MVSSARMNLIREGGCGMDGWQDQTAEQEMSSPEVSRFRRGAKEQLFHFLMLAQA